MVGKLKMRSILLKYLTTMGIVVTLAFMVGCDDADVLDEIGTRYHVSSITFDDNGNETTADAVVTACASGVEPETVGSVALTITSDEDMDTDGHFYELDVEIDTNIPGLSRFTRLPRSFTQEDISCLVDSNGGSCTYTLYLFPYDIKTSIRDDIIAAGFTLPHTIRVSLTPYITYTITEGVDEHYTPSTVRTPVTIGEVDNCPASS